MTTSTVAELRARYTMRHGQVAELFGLPRQTLRDMLAAGTITLTGVRFGGNTSPFRYDPVEVQAELARYTTALHAQVGATPGNN